MGLARPTLFVVARASRMLEGRNCSGLSFHEQRPEVSRCAKEALIHASRVVRCCSQWRMTMRELEFFALSMALFFGATFVISQFDDKDTYKIFKVGVAVALVMIGSVGLCLFLTPGCAAWRAMMWGE